MGLNDSKAKLPTRTIFILISHNLNGGMGYYTGKGNSRQFITVANLSGNVISMTREFDEGSPADKVKPHHKYNLLFQDGEEAYNVCLPEYTTYATEVMNQLLGCNSTKLELHVRFWDRNEKKVRLTLLENGAEVPRFYNEWDSINQTCKGIPSTKLDNGDTDYKARNAFWFEKFKSILYPKFNRGAEWSESNTAPVKETAAVNIHEGVNQTPHVQTFNQVAPPKAGLAKEVLDKLLKRIETSISDKSILDIWSNLIKFSKEQQATSEQLNHLAATATNLYKTAFPNEGEGHYIFHAEGGFSVAAPTTAPDDDLPF